MKPWRRLRPLNATMNPEGAGAGAGGGVRGASTRSTSASDRRGWPPAVCGVPTFACRIHWLRVEYPIPIRSAAARTVSSDMSASIAIRVKSYCVHGTARVRLDDEPDVAARPQVERLVRRRREMHLNRDADLHL